MNEVEVTDKSATADIGLVGLAVMGQNLVLNMDDNGFTVAVFNRTTSKVDDFLMVQPKVLRLLVAMIFLNLSVL